MNLKKSAYKKGIVETNEHYSLKKGQVVDIISEKLDVYLVQSYQTSKPEFVKKQDIKMI